MFERFTNKARHVVVLAQEEARKLGHSYIGTEHVLLGLLGETDGLAFRALEGFGMILRCRRPPRSISRFRSRHRAVQQNQTLLIRLLRQAGHTLLSGIPVFR